MSFLRKGPNFICIGPERTGTNWLYTNLNEHPQINLPPVKEIRYFWEKVFLPDENVIKRLTGSHWHYRNTRRHFRRLIKAILLLEIKKIHWYIKFLFFPHTDEWYISLFDAAQEKVSGDITSLYYQLPEREIRRISNLLSSLKIIILLRNPVERAWSKAKMNLLKHQNQKIMNISVNHFYEHFDKEFNILNSYVFLVNRWTKYFSQQNVIIKYFDELVENPVEFIQSLAIFLNVDPKYYVSKSDMLKKKINTGLELDLPRDFSRYLANLYEDCIAEMYEYGFPYSKNWLDKNKNLVQMQSWIG